MMTEPFETLLAQGIADLSLNMPIEPLLSYLDLLQKWNKAYNLTAIRDKADMVVKHCLDSLSIAQFVQGNRLLDVGSGAGLPGIPLALQNPERPIVLLDSNGKKTRFLREVKRQLRLSHVEIIESRVEAYHPEERFDTITSRAFSELTPMIQWTEHLIADHGIWLAMKGRHPDSELASLQYPHQVIHYEVPYLPEERHCVIIQKHP
jgi:16S rRNA (guanine527-N7)-methyltransferase